MIRVLDRIFDHIQHGPQRKKVEQYLRNTTPDSLLDDLRKALSPSLSAINGLWTTFEAFSFYGPLQEHHYWTKESLHKHIEKVHPYTNFSSAIIDLLWACFYFYAYHPFPRRDVDDGRIEWPAFQRSVSLLALRGTELLGTLEDGDYSWRYDVWFTCKVNFNRILRSISHLEDPDKQQHSQPSFNTSTFIVDDVMDVLAMTQPWDISVPPSPDLLKPAAQKLISRGGTPMQFFIGGEELSLLLSLLLRLRLYKTKWAREFHYGSFDEQCSQNDELAHILADRLAGSQDTVLTIDQTQKGLDMLPNLELYFHQLWSTLFQPPMAVNMSAQGTVQLDPSLDRILRMASLFISQHIVSGDSQTAQKDPLIMFERLDASSSQGLSNNLSYSHLIKALAQNSSQPNHLPQLIIVFGNTSTPSPTPVVMGAFSPGMLWATKLNDTEEKRKWASHILFQLQPKFRLLRWTGSHMPLSTDFICLDDEAIACGTNMQSLKATAMNDGISHESYWIGASEGTKTGLHINPGTRMATLRTIATPNKSGGSGRYEDIGVERNGNGDAGLEEDSLTKDKTKFTVSQIAVFKAKSGTDANVCSGETLTGKDESRYRHRRHETRIEGEELAKRIQGFGST